MSSRSVHASLEDLSWPSSRIAEAIAILARQLGRTPASHDVSELSHTGKDVEIDRAIASTAKWLGLEAEPVEAPYADLTALLSRSGPSLLQIAGDGPPKFMVLARGARKSVELVGPDFERHRVPLEELENVVVSGQEVSARESVDQFLDQAGVEPARRPKARSVLLRERLAERVIGACWLLRLPPCAGTWEQARAARLPRYLTGFCAAHTLAGLVGLASWWVIGRGALNGHIDTGWLLAWALLLATLIPFRLLALWYQGLFSVAAGSLLKGRLLEGALRLHPDEIRLQGAGHHMGRVIESEAVETLALRGGFLALMSVIDIFLAALVLSAGAGGGLLLIILLTWVMVAVHLGRRFFLQRQRWTRDRLRLSQDLVEKMIGHRTRLAQQSPSRWYDGEDRALTGYLTGSQDVDRATVKVAILPRVWLVVALLGLAPTFLSGGGTMARVAVSLGGILLAYRAMEALREGFSFLADAAIAWKQIGTLFQAAARPEMLGDPRASARNGHQASTALGASLLDATDLVYQHPGRGEPVIRGLSLRIRSGERLVMRSPSGGGKSTLVSLLNGSRTSDSGELLLGGLDRHSIGDEGWTRRIASAPQFNENHVFSETFAFNLLMGRRWPPAGADLDDAEATCRELGLADLLERMPGGLQQMVGETGWQLSHGERSRLFIARALLQGGDLIVLDESFAALDPENLRRSLDCALHRAPTLLVISHS
ncbi:MAG: ATP-binding cassette domain-containing protein [Vicinamibacteria bacterium]